MADTSSWTQRNIRVSRDRATVRKMNDAIYELYRPATGLVEIDIIFFHGFHFQNYEDAYLRSWMIDDDSACWLNTWLTQEFPKARILSVSYDSISQVSDSSGRTDMDLVGEYFARSMIGLEGIGQTCPVVLVGHCVGGLVLKEVCLRAEQMARETGQGIINPYRAFLKHVKGVFSYSMASSGSRIMSTSKQPRPLVQYLELLSTDAARLNDNFAKLRHRHGWKTFGVSEANKSEDGESLLRVPNPFGRLLGRRPQYALVVEEASARYDMDEFCVLPGVDNLSICKPKDRSSSSFLHLVRFVREILQIEVRYLRSCFECVYRITERLLRLSGYGETSMANDTGTASSVCEYAETRGTGDSSASAGQKESLRVALVGMGGIGKTTLAKAVLIQIRSQFDFSCFVEDLKDKVIRHNLHELVLDNLYTSRGRKVRLQNNDPQSLWLHLQGKKVLMIMDDVESEYQVAKMLSPKWLGSGSRLMVTSRIQSRGLLPSFAICELNVLTNEESEDLFLAHLDADAIRDIPKDLIKKVEKKCDGLPLTLDVIGSYLCFASNIDVWTSSLTRLTAAESLSGSVDDRLWAKLRVSFDHLAPLERKMFLDLAVFDKCDSDTDQYDAQLWRTVWISIFHDSSVFSGVRNLVDRSFIQFRGPMTKKMKIHEQLRDMGKSISRPSHTKVELCRGVWLPDDISYLLSKHKGDEAETEVLSASLDPSGDFQRPYPWSSIGRLHALRLLRLSNVSMIGNEAQRFPCNLVFLHLNSCNGRPAKKFQFLRTNCWPIREEDVEGLHQLAVLRLENCSSVRLPSNFHKLTNLKVLIIHGKNLKNLPEKFGCLPALEELYLENVGLSQLPDSFFRLSSLQTLSLKGCSALNTAFSPTLALRRGKSFRPLSSLTDLTLENLEGLTELPESLGLLESLVCLQITRCSDLKKLPEGLGKLQDLLVLQIEGCEKLESLCESIGELPTLALLMLDTCPRLQVLPDSVGQLSELIELYMNRMNFVSLPESIGELENLRVLSITGLEYLQSVPDTLGELKSLEYVSFVSCISLESLPDSFGQLDSLRKITISDGWSLGRLPESIGQLRNLKIMRIEGCDCLDELPDSLGHLRNLNTLIVSRCCNLESLPYSLGHLSSLEGLEVQDCEKVRVLPESVGELTNLNRLNLSGCKNLQSLPKSFRQLEALIELDLSGSNNLENLAESIGELERLSLLSLPLRYQEPMDSLLNNSVHVVYDEQIAISLPF